MSMQGRIQELSTRHRSLEESIQREQKRPSADQMLLQDLKRRKLRIKEELRELKAN